MHCKNVLYSKMLPTQLAADYLSLPKDSVEKFKQTEVDYSSSVFSDFPSSKDVKDIIYVISQFAVLTDAAKYLCPGVDSIKTAKKLRSLIGPKIGHKKLQKWNKECARYLNVSYNALRLGEEPSEVKYVGDSSLLELVAESGNKTEAMEKTGLSSSDLEALLPDRRFSETYAHAAARQLGNKVFRIPEEEELREFVGMVTVEGCKYGTPSTHYKDDLVNFVAYYENLKEKKVKTFKDLVALVKETPKKVPEKKRLDIKMDDYPKLAAISKTIASAGFVDEGIDEYYKDRLPQYLENENIVLGARIAFPSKVDFEASDQVIETTNGIKYLRID